MDNWVKFIATTLGFISLKEYRENFERNPSCRLINPTKSQREKVSQNMLDLTRNIIRETLLLNQWKNIRAPIDWFNRIPDKEILVFIQFDIKDFYLLIKE